jgi:hypothetical protein
MGKDGGNWKAASTIIDKTDIKAKLKTALNHWKEGESIVETTHTHGQTQICAYTYSLLSYAEHHDLADLAGARTCAHLNNVAIPRKERKTAPFSFHIPA